jgi:hypothetical protein
MIAAFDDGKELHIIKWTGRVRLHAGVINYCGKEGDASDGVLQVPDAVFERGVPFTVGVNAGVSQKRPPCGRCRTAAQAAIS